MTVSTVVNKRQSSRPVAAATRKRINDFINQYGYVPSRHATSLKRGRSNVIGILHTGRLYSHLTDAINLMTDRFVDAPEDFETVIVGPKRYMEGLRELIARGVTNLIWVSPRLNAITGRPFDQILNLLSGRKVVLYGYFPLPDERHQRLLDAGIAMVGFDRRKGFAEVGHLLASHGHRAACLPQLRDDPILLSDNLAFLGLTDAGLEVFGSHPEGDEYAANEWAVKPSMAEGIFQAMRERGATAACFTDDAVAAQVLTQLVERGLRVPDDLSVTSMDGLAWSSLLRWPLTTLKVPTEDMVSTAEQMLRDDQRPRVELLPLELIPRSTHGPAPTHVS